MQLQLTRDNGVGLAIGGVDLLDPGEPRVGRAIGDQLDGGVNGHGAEGIVLQSDGLVGLCRGGLAIAIGEGKIGHELMRFGQLRIEFQGLRQIYRGLTVETGRRHDGKSEKSLSV